MGDSSAVSKGISGGGATPISPAAKSTTSCGRRRQVVGDVEDAAGLGLRQVQQRAGDVVDMDAVEHLARLDDALGAAVGEVAECVAAGPVDARQAQHRRPGSIRLRRASSHASSAVEAHARARRDRPGWRGLVDPCAAMVAIDADGREVADPAQLRHGGADRFAPATSRTGSPPSSGAIETTRCVGFEQARGDLGDKRRAVEEMRLDAGRAQRLEIAGRPGRPVDP